MTDLKTGTAQEQKLLRLVRIQTLLIALLLVALSVFVVLTARSLNRMDRSIDLVEQDLAAMDMDRINEAVTALTNAANRLSGVDLDELNGAVSALKEAATQLSAVDVEVLNQTIASLEGAADALAAVDVKSLNTAIASLGQAADTLKGLDIDSLNGIISSLDQTIQSLNRVSDTLKSAVDGIKGIFG